MGFLAPWFLAGLAALSAPVWLHLLRQHKSEPKKFSSLMFFERRTQSSIIHRRLRYYLLLAVRLALLALLALAFAEPFVHRPPSAFGDTRKLVVIAVDRSFSMREGKRMAGARETAVGLLSRIRSGDQGQVLALGPGVEVLSQPSSEVETMSAAIRRLEAGGARTSFPDLSRALNSIAQSSRFPVEAHFVSDMQKSGLGASFVELRLNSNVRLELHDVNGEQRNFAVETVRVGRRLYDPKKFRLEATISGFGASAASKKVSLLVNGRVAISKTVEVPAGGRARAEFISIDAPYGWNRGEVLIEPADSLDADDRFRFAFERADPRRVLFLYEARNPRALVYFRSAIESTVDAAFSVDALTADQAGSLALEKYSVVVLSDLASLPPGFEEKLAAYVRDGRSVLIALGPSAATRTRVPVFDEKIVESRYASRTGERFLSAVLADATHPAVRRAGQWEGVRFYQVIRVEPGKSAVINRLSDQTPLLLEKKMGEGRVMVFASTLDNVANDFPLHASFVPFIEQAVNHLAMLEESPPSVAVDSYLDLRKDQTRAGAAEVIGPDGKRVLSLAEAAKAQSVRLEHEGYYELRRTSGRQELIAVNADRRESDLEPASKETLSLWQNTGEGGLAPTGGEPGAETESRPVSFWRTMVMLLLVAALVESLLARRHLAHDSPEEPGARREAA